MAALPTVVMRLPESLYLQAKAEAERSGRPMTKVLEKALTLYVMAQSK